MFSVTQPKKKMGCECVFTASCIQYWTLIFEDNAVVTVHL